MMGFPNAPQGVPQSFFVMQVLYDGDVWLLTAASRDILQAAQCMCPAGTLFCDSFSDECFECSRSLAAFVLTNKYDGATAFFKQEANVCDFVAGQLSPEVSTGALLQVSQNELEPLMTGRVSFRMSNRPLTLTGIKDAGQLAKITRPRHIGCRALQKTIPHSTNPTEGTRSNGCLRVLRSKDG
jgi:hypothetical protein